QATLPCAFWLLASGFWLLGSGLSLHSFPYHQHFERVRHETAASLSRLSREGVRYRQINVMSFLIDRNGARAPRRSNVIEDIVFSAHFLNDGQRAVAIRADGVSGTRIESNSIRSLADCGRGQNFARIRIRNRHDPVAANGKQPAFLDVDRKTRRAVARF